MKELVVELLESELAGQLSADAIAGLIEVPPSAEMGDFAFPCFSLARTMRKNPAAIAAELREKLHNRPEFDEIRAVSGYLNFFMNKKKLVESILTRAESKDFARGGSGKKVVVEFASPNTNKPLHLGHLRNISIGESVSRIMEMCGDKVVRTSINNDRGVHICKSMLAYEREGKGATPQSAGKKSDHFVGDYYVLFSKRAAVETSWNDDAQEMLRKWEANDPDVRRLWKTMNKWALDGFAATFALFGIRFDKEYYESEIYTFGKEIIEQGIEKKIFSRRSDNAAVADLSEDNLGEKVLLRPDNTSVYIVQDIYLAHLKKREHGYDRSIYVVGNEQEHHFAVLKAILKKLGSETGDAIYHLSYGMVELPEGRMKSREGTVVDADDLIQETADLAATEVRERYSSLGKEQVSERSLKIALAAIKYQLLRVDTARNMCFDPKKAISFEGDTGPYLLYSYARASSILRKSATLSTTQESENEDSFNDSELALVKKIDAFPETVKAAYRKLSPSVVANYGFELSQAFNEFYHNSPVLSGDRTKFRLRLVGAFREVLGRTLDLLGIERIEEM